MKRHVSGRDQKKLHKQRSKTLRILEKYHIKKGKAKSVSNICLLSSLTYSHAREEMKYSRDDWLTQAKSESATVWKSYEKKDAYRVNQCWLVARIMTHECSFIYHLWNSGSECDILTFPAELFDLIWGRTLWSSALLGREMLTTEQYNHSKQT